MTFYNKYERRGLPELTLSFLKGHLKSCKNCGANEFLTIGGYDKCTYCSGITPTIITGNEPKVKPIFTNHVYNTNDQEVIKYLDYCVANRLYDCISETEYYNMNPKITNHEILELQ
jgi:hypothetical protein